jgi:hypothetical protein
MSGQFEQLLLSLSTGRREKTPEVTILSLEDRAVESARCATAAP